MSHASTNSLPGGAYATLDLRDGDEAARAQMAKQEGDRRFAGQLRRAFPVLADSEHVDMGDEVVGIRTREHEDLDGIVAFGSLNDRDQVGHQFGPQQVHRRGIDRCEQNRAFVSDVEGLLR